MPLIDPTAAITESVAELREALRDAEQRKGQGWRLSEALSRAHTAVGWLEFQITRSNRQDPARDALQELRQVVREAVALLDLAISTATYKDGLSIERVLEVELLGPALRLLKTVSSD